MTDAIKKYMNSLTPFFLRSPIVVAILETFAKSIDSITDLFLIFRDREKWLLYHNSQIVYLEHFLNTEFGIVYSVSTRDADIGSGSIIWIESENKIPLYIYNKVEQKQRKILYNKSESGAKFYLNNYSEFLATSSFIVWFPVAVPYDDAVVRDLVDFYKLGGKTYTIQTY